MNPARCIVWSVLLSLPASAQVPASLRKAHHFTQTTAVSGLIPNDNTNPDSGPTTSPAWTGTVASDAAIASPWFFAVSIDPSATGTTAFTPPGGSSQSFASTFSAAFASQSALDAKYPNGAYALQFSGQTDQLSLGGDAYPNAPLVTIRTDAVPFSGQGVAVFNNQNGIITIDPTAVNVFSTKFTANYSAGHAFMQIKLLFADGTSLTADSGTNFSLSQLALKIPANSLTAASGSLVVTLFNYSNVDQSSVPGFYIGASYASQTQIPIQIGFSTKAAITTQPQSQSVALGGTATFTVSTTGAIAISYQWMQNGKPVGGSGPTLTIQNAQLAAAGDYTVTVLAANNTTVTSDVATLTVVTPSPVILQQPQNATVTLGQTVTVGGGVLGAGNTYQWYFNGAALPGATSQILMLPNVQFSNAGTYYYVVSNAGGTVTSASAVLTVQAQAPTSAPVFAPNPSSLLMLAGTTGVLNSQTVSSVPVTYQWSFNGSSLPGATSPRLVLFGVNASNVGSYTCAATNSGGTTVSNPATVTLLGDAKALPSHLANLSVLSTVTAGGTPFTIGFQSGGSGTSGSQNLLIRATGPALIGLGQTGTVADPVLSVYTTVNGQATVVATNDNWWQPSPNQAAVTTADAATFAFPLVDPTGLDAALVTTLSPNGYSVQISDKSGGGGLSLGEVYDNTPVGTYTTASSRLINLSCINQVPANGILTAGFVLTGNTARAILIRGIGPALGGFGVPGTMADPQIKLFGTINNQQQQLTANAGWTGDSALSAVGNYVHAFAIADPASHDAMILVMLNQGSYSVQLSSAKGSAGTALIEIYEVP